MFTFNCMKKSKKYIKYYVSYINILFLDRTYSLIWSEFVVSKIPNTLGNYVRQKDSQLVECWWYHTVEISQIFALRFWSSLNIYFHTL